MRKYVVRAVADRDGTMETVDDKDAEVFGVYEICNDGTQEWVADFSKNRKAEAVAFRWLMERQSTVSGR